MCAYVKDYRTFLDDYYKIVDFYHYLVEERIQI